MHDAIGQALEHLAAEASVTREEWRTQRQGDDGLLDALVSHGYATERHGRFVVSATGRARLADVKQEPEE